MFYGGGGLFVFGLFFYIKMFFVTSKCFLLQLTKSNILIILDYGYRLDHP